MTAGYGVVSLGPRKTLTSDTVYDMYEYVYRVNVGEDMRHFMYALTATMAGDLQEFI